MKLASLIVLVFVGVLIGAGAMYIFWSLLCWMYNECKSKSAFVFQPGSSVVEMIWSNERQ